jgi:hypothetical protein
VEGVDGFSLRSGKGRKEGREDEVSDTFFSASWI